MTAKHTGVYPAHLIKFEIEVAPGASGAAGTMAIIADCEGVNLTVDGNVEEWNPYDTKGWTRRLMTGKAFTMGLTAKRNVGDAGNDFIASKMMAMGIESNTKASLTFPDGSKLLFNCVVNVSNPGTGETREVATLEFELLSDGEPTYTAATRSGGSK